MKTTLTLLVIFYLIGYFISYYYLRKYTRKHLEELYDWDDVLFNICCSLLSWIVIIMNIKLPKPPKWL